MSPLPADLLLGATTSRHSDVRSASSNGTDQAIQVVCAWPVSGQYGPGARILYYVLIVACIFARKTEWVRNVCLAAALLFPAVAAIHGIVLAAVHVDGGVDMDIYGTLQLCAIGALAGPVTASRSQTYFKTPGRNTIFVWAAIILAGLLSLAVEFYRDSSVPARNGCTRNAFTYGKSKCGLICDPNDGPFSPIRGGSANNIDVIIAPHIITFNAGMLLAAACCIPAILLLISLSIRIFESEAEDKPEDPDDTGHADEQQLARPNGDVPKDKMQAGEQVHTLEHSTAERGSQSDTESQGHRSQPEVSCKFRAVRMIRLFQQNFEVPVFGAAILAIVIIGERNFFSKPVKYDTEPMANVGQWAPILGIVLTILGSVYLLVAEAIEYERDPEAERKRYMSQAQDHAPSKLARRGARYSMKLGAELRRRFRGDQTTSSELQQRIHEMPEIPGEENRNAQAMRIRAYSSGDRSRSPAPSERSARTPAAGPGSPNATALERRDTLDIPSSPLHKSSAFDPDRISMDLTESPQFEPTSLSLQHTPPVTHMTSLRRRTESFPVYSGHAPTDEVPETPDIWITTESRAASRRPSLAAGAALDGRARSH